MAPGRRPFKILYLQSTSEVGGTDVTLLRTLRALDKKHFEPHIVLSKSGPFVESYEKAGCKVHFIPEMRKLKSRKGLSYLIQFVLGYFPAVFKISKLIQREKIRLLHTNTIHNWYGFLAAKFARVPHVWHIREIVVQNRFIGSLERMLVENFSDRFIVMDNAIAQPFAGKNRGFSKNAVKLYDGIDLHKFHPDTSGERIRKELGIPLDAPLLGTVCRLDPWKGLELFIETARLVHSEIPEAYFLICGGEIEGHEGYEERLYQKAFIRGLGSRMIFTGWRYFGDAIPEIYAALTISVQCPLHPEPYGLANIEAMASSVPVVTFNEGGPAEICENEKTALLVSEHSPQALSQAILALLRNPGHAKALGEAGRKRAEQLFDDQRCTRELEKIYFGILNKAL